MATLRRAALKLLPLPLLALVPACGGDNPSRPPIEVVTPQPVRGIIAQTGFSDFQTDFWVALEVQTSARGIIDITVDWTFPDSWIYVYFGKTKCEYAQLANRSCPFLVSSETQLPKPRKLTTDTLDPGTYYLVLYNVPKDLRRGIGSDHSEAVSVVMGLTVSPTSQAGAQPIRLGQPVVLRKRPL
jgi:hypothetical protein